MKRIINIIFLVAVATICSTSCEKSYHYIIEGRLIDKTSKEPIKDIMVSFNKYDSIVPRGGQKTKKYPIGGPEWSNENGEFRTLETYSTPLLYIYGYSSNLDRLYKDTTISVDFSHVSLSGKSHNNYMGDYVLNIGDIELEKNKGN